MYADHPAIYVFRVVTLSLFNELTMTFQFIALSPTRQLV